MVQVNPLGQCFDPNVLTPRQNRGLGGLTVKGTLADSLSKKVVSEHPSTAYLEVAHVLARN